MALNGSSHITGKEIKQMEQELSRLEYELYEQYYEVGKGILEKAEQESRKINCLVDQIIEARRKLAEAQREKRCSQCAEANDHNSLYCKRCGARLPEGDDIDIKEDNDGTR